jgi:hypothetical protein
MNEEPQDFPEVEGGGAVASGSLRLFASLLYEQVPSRAAEQEREQDRSFAQDLNLDQVVAAIVGKREDAEFLTALFYGQLHDVNTVRYRQEVFRDLEDDALWERIHHFDELMAQVRTRLKSVGEMEFKQLREGWFLDAAAIYCEAVQSMAEVLASADLRSRGLLSFGKYLDGYVASTEFTALARDTRDRKDALAQIRYCTRIRGGRVDVSRYEDEADYSAEVLKTFERFKQGGVQDYRVKYRGWPGMNHVQAQIVERVARLFPEEFSALDDYCRRHTAFLDRTVHRFARELRFYLAYLAYIRPLRSAGLSFCYPGVSRCSKEVYATDTFDLALAEKLVSESTPVVTNDFKLEGRERIFVVSGPNQGGKTTFARTFGQLHHLASVGCPVPGSAVRIFLFDRLFTHFEREEDLARMRGKLEDDIARIGATLRAATPESIVILNEIFTSTTLQDARFLSKKVMTKVMQLDLLCVYVTFVDELASLGESVVSMVSTIVPQNPSERTFKVVRGPANGLAYALAIAEKHNVTYERLADRLVRSVAS